MNRVINYGGKCGSIKVFKCGSIKLDTEKFCVFFEFGDLGDLGDKTGNLLALPYTSTSPLASFAKVTEKDKVGICLGGVNGGSKYDTLNRANDSCS